jgi:Mg/Co/Ni transporter MgtE
VLEEVRASRLAPGVIETIYVVDAAYRLVGVFLVTELLRRDPTEAVGTAATRTPVCVRPDADIPEIALTMTDFNLTVLPVVDAAMQLIGVIAVDDLLEVMLPNEWRTVVGSHPPPAPEASTPSAG